MKTCLLAKCVMKVFAIILLFTGLTQVVCAQRKVVPSDEVLFDKAVMLQQLANNDLDLENVSKNDSLRIRADYASEIRNHLLEKSLLYYQNLLDRFPHSTLKYRALSNKAWAELALGNTDEAKEVFLAVISGQANDKERGGKGTGLGAEPYTNYKNNAAKGIATIFLQENDYSSALTYLDLTKKFPYQHFCGNEYAADDIYMSELYAKCYLGLKNYPKAYVALLPNILENNLADNSKLVELAYSALLKNYSRDELKRQFEQVPASLETISTKSGKEEYERYFLTFLGVRFQVEPWDFAIIPTQDRARKIAEMCRNSKFYTLLTQ